MKKLIKLFINSAIISSMLLSSVSVFASTSKRVVKISTGSQIANVNGENITLSIAPYVQKPSNSMMIPLRFVSTALGINENNIQYMPTTKEIIITNNDTNVKFIVGSSELVINGESFDMAMKDDDTGKLDYIYTEVKNGSTFIPLRSLESAFSVKIDWINETKTAVLTNEIANVTTNIQVEEQPIIEDVNSSLDNNNQSSLYDSQDINLSTIKENIDNENLTIIDESKFDELLELSKKNNSVLYSELQVIKLINEERVKNGLNPLLVSVELMQVSEAKVNDMKVNDYFSHYDKNGNDSFAQYLGIEEDLTTSTTPDSIISSFMNSRLHRESLMRENHKYIGVGINDYATAILLDGKAGWQSSYSEWEEWYNSNK